MYFQKTKLAIALATTVTLIGCGGGSGGGTVVKNIAPSNGDTISLSLPNISNVFGLSETRNFSVTQQGEIDELMAVFNFVRSTSLNDLQADNTTIVIDGQELSLQDAWNVLQGVTTQFYDGREAFWHSAAANGHYDDSEAEFAEIAYAASKTNGLTTADQINYFKDIGTGTKPADDLDTVTTTAPTTFNAYWKSPDPIQVYQDPDGSLYFYDENNVKVQFEPNIHNTSDSVESSEITLSERTYTVVSDPVSVTSHRDYTEVVDDGTNTTTTTYRETIITTTTYTRTYKDIISTTTVTYTNGGVDTASSVESTTLISEVPSVTTNVDSVDIIDQSSVANAATIVSYNDVTTTETITTVADPFLYETITTTDTREDGVYTIYYDYWHTVTTITTTTTTTRTNTWSDDSITQEVIDVQSNSVETTDVNVTTRYTVDDLPPPDPEAPDNGDGGGSTTTTVTQPTLDYDPATYDAATYYNSEFIGTPTVVTSHDPADHYTTEFENNANEHIHANYAYARGWTGKGSTIMIMDTGIDTNHADLQSKIKYTWDPGYEDGHEDTHGHGTHVAGIAAAAKNDTGTHGVAYDANLAVARISDRGFGYSYALQALAWANQYEDIVVANLSANANYDTAYKNSITDHGNGIYTSNHIHYGGANYYNMEDPTQWAAALGSEMVVTVAAGNHGLDYVANPATFATAVDSNGNLLLNGQMMVVGNWNATNGDLDGSSNAAGHVCKDYTTQCNDPYLTKEFYIMAPGVVVNSTTNNGDYGTMTGTSMAAPVVAGAVAIVHQLWPYMKGANIAKLLFHTADKDFTGYNENKHGQGLLDLDQATRPVGELQIALDGRTGTTSSINGSINFSGIDGGAVSSISAVDDFDRDYTVNLSGLTGDYEQSVALMQHKRNDIWAARLAGMETNKVGNYLASVSNNGNHAIGYSHKVFDEPVHFNMSYTSSDSSPWIQMSGMWGEVKRSRTLEANVTYDFDKNTWAKAGIMNSSTDFETGIVTEINDIQSVYAAAGYDKNNWSVYGGVKPYALGGDVTMKLPTSVDRNGIMHYSTVKQDIKTPVTGFVGVSHNYTHNQHSTTFTGIVDSENDSYARFEYKYDF